MKAPTFSRPRATFLGLAAVLLFVLGAAKFVQTSWLLASRDALGDFWVIFPAPYFARWRPDFPPATNWSGWYYGPMAHFLGIPLLLVPRWSMVPLVWALVNLAGLVTSFVLACRLAGWTRRVSWPVTVALAGLWLSYLPLRNCFAQGNVELAELVLLLAGAVWLQRGRGALAGVCVGVATMIKFLPVVFLGWLVVQRRWRAVATAAASIALIAVLTSMTLGWSRSDLFNVQRGERFRGVVGQATVSNLSVTSAFLHAASLFVVQDIKDHYEVRLRWFPASRERFAALSGEIASVLLAVTFGCLFLLRRTEEISALEVSACFLAMVLLGPWNQEYYYVFSVVPLSILFLRAVAERRWTLLAVTLAAYACVSPPLPFGWIDRAQWFRASFAYVVNYAGLPIVGGLLFAMTVTHEMLRESPGVLASIRVGSRRAWTVAAAVVAVMVLVWMVSSRRTVAAASIDALALEPPVLLSGPPALALSPDGSRLAYIASVNEKRVLCVTVPESRASTCWSEVTEAAAPFFSTDGRWIGFFDAGGLRKVRVAGGRVTVVAGAAEGGHSGTWTREDAILYATSNGIYRVAATGGGTALLMAGTPDSQYFTPTLLPSGEALLFTIAPPSGGWGAGTIVAQSLTTGQRTRVVTGSQPFFDGATGHLVYTIGGRVLAVAFDPDTLAVSKASRPLIENTLVTVDGGAQYALSQDGSIVYATNHPTPAIRRSLMWVDRHGEATPLSMAPNAFETPRLSPDGRTLAVAIRDVATDVWTYDMTSGAPTRSAFAENVNDTPIWRPDGRALSFAVPTLAQLPFLVPELSKLPPVRSARWPFGLPNENPPTPAVLSTSITGAGGPPTLIWRADGSDRLFAPVHLSDWSRDGRVLAGSQSGGLWLLQLSVETPPMRGLDHSLPGRPSTPWARIVTTRTPASDGAPVFSPDGRWIAYASSDGGLAQVFVRSFPDLDEPRRLSRAGGTEPVWSPDGRELFYRERHRLMAVSVSPGPPFSASGERELFGDVYVRGNDVRNFDVAPDGQHFVMIRADSPFVSNSLQTLRHWSALLAR